MLSGKKSLSFMVCTAHGDQKGFRYMVESFRGRQIKKQIFLVHSEKGV
jgi:hypothetical protein